MAAILKRIQHTLLIAVVGALGLSLFAPIVALGNGDLSSGETAIISTGGGAATVRSAPSTSAEPVGSVPDGTEVFIVNGPVTGDDGSLWYEAGVWDLTGYISATLLSSTASEQEVTADEPVPTVLPWKQPIDYGVVVNNNGSLPAEGLACRDAASTSGQVITRIALGTTVEVTGQGAWAEGIEFLPVNCVGQGGYVRADYVQLNSETAPTADPAPEQDEPASDPEPAASETEPAADEAQTGETEPVVENTPSVGDLIVTVVDQHGEAVAGVCFDLYGAAGWVANACDSTDAIPNNGNSGFFGVGPGGYSVVPSSVPDGVTLNSIEASVTAGETTWATAYATVPASDVVDEPVQEEVVEEPVATEEPVADDTTDEPVTEEVTEKPVAEEATDAATDDPATEDATEEPVEDEATEEPVVDDVTEDPAGDEDATEEPVVEEATEEPVVDEATEEPVDDEATDEAATDEATDDTAADEATEEAVSPEIVSEVVTRAVTDAVNNQTAAAGDQASDDDPATGEADSSGPDLSAAIGDATVTGTDGEGVRCRVAPDAAAATITVLSEGATVFVLQEPVNGYLGVLCADQPGWANVEYMWAGGAGDEIPASASSVVVVGTGGARLNCRTGPGTSYGVVTSVPMGSVLTSRGASSNGWAPVVCNGTNAFVSINFVEVSASSSSDNSSGDSTSGATASTGVISNLGGDRLRCRTSAPSGSIITMLTENTVVTVRGATSNGWVPIVCAGQNGFVSSAYITLGSSSGNNGGSTDGSNSGNSGGASTGYVTVTGTGGAALNCRSAASLAGMVITAIPAGTTMEVKGPATNGWQPVTCGGRSGYVSTAYLTAASGPGTSNPPANSGDNDSGSDSGTTDTATVTSSTPSMGVNCRISPGGNVITVVSVGTVVTTRGASSNGWTPVVCGGQNGYISSDLLRAGGSSTPPPTSTPSPGQSSGMAAGDHAKLTANVNLRFSASTSANVSTVVPSGTVVKIKSGPSDNFYQIDWDGLGGYLYADYLTKTSEALSKRGGSASPNLPDSPPANNGGTATGNAIVNYAMRYIGYPYVWATSGPSSFDCSGFTSWVARNVLGMNIGTGLWTQSVAGTAVSRSDLQPGDLVLFQNTYKAGLSHVGIYIGNGQFVHAENENTGVRVSDLNSNYYGSRWYGARRLA